MMQLAVSCHGVGNHSASLFVRFDPISYFYPKSLASRVEYAGRSVLAAEVHVLKRARQAASTATPCSMKSYFYNSNTRVLQRSNAALRRHQSRRRPHAASQQHVGQLQVRSYNEFCICVYAYIYASGVHMSCDPLATCSPFRGSTPSQDQPEKLRQDFHLAIYNTFIYPNASGYIYLSS